MASPIHMQQVICCAPTGQCGTPRIETQEIVQFPKIKDVTIHTNQPNIYPVTLREVGPLNNNVREGPITTIMYKRMYCTTIPYQHPAPRNPAIYCASQPKGTNITTRYLLGDAKGSNPACLYLQRKMWAITHRLVVVRTTRSLTLYASDLLRLSIVRFILSWAFWKLVCASANAIFILSSASFTASFEILGFPHANSIVGMTGCYPEFK